jgi:uncharacterized membrane protein YdjX (TVP38/TMEM64 family)
MSQRRKYALGALMLLTLILLLAFQPHSILTLEKLKSARNDLQQSVDSAFFLSAGIYFVVYILSTAISIPGATVLSLAGGAVFGFPVALLIISFASTIGATLAFLLARYFFRDLVEQRSGDRLNRIHRGFEGEGAFYLFALRLVPAFPFFAINVLLGLTRIRAWTFYWVSQVGMLPGTMAYVYAGTELGQLQSLDDVLSPGMIGAFAILGVLPLISKRALARIRERRSDVQAP